MVDDAGRHVVIGSGPAGVSCAHALLERGVPVIMLDGGLTLEPDRAGAVARMGAGEPDMWRPEDRARLYDGVEARTHGLGAKLTYGSDFAYRACAQHAPTECDGVDLKPSLARGGLSNVWGGAMLPYVSQDLRGWPLGVDELTTHYRSALTLTGLAARDDALGALFPLYASRYDALQASRQAVILDGNLERSRSRLTRSGIHFGQARNAIRVGGESGCRYCGVCMLGCPYGCIYNAQDTLADLKRHPEFAYQPDVVVTRLQESTASVRILGTHRLTGAPFEATARRVFLASGVVPTTEILMRSLGLSGRTLWMGDSQCFLMPLLMSRGAPDVRHERLQTLAQHFLEIQEDALSPFTVHLQIYGYNDLFGGVVRRRLGPLARPLERLARHVEDRLLIALGYLHSAHSARIGVTLMEAPERLRLSCRANPQTRPMVGRVVRKLLRHAWHLGAAPVPFAVHLFPAGKGFHSGGTFPMATQPGPTQSDLLGRPAGWQRVHVVDATVFPTIPATTITLSVMANAHRIGWEGALLP